MFDTIINYPAPKEPSYSYYCGRCNFEYKGEQQHNYCPQCTTAAEEKEYQEMAQEFRDMDVDEFYRSQGY